jgi:hypothetical protein
MNTSPPAGDWAGKEGSSLVAGRMLMEIAVLLFTAESHSAGFFYAHRTWETNFILKRRTNDFEELANR